MLFTIGATQYHYARRCFTRWGVPCQQEPILQPNIGVGGIITEITSIVVTRHKLDFQVLDWSNVGWIDLDSDVALCSQHS